MKFIRKKIQRILNEQFSESTIISNYKIEGSYENIFNKLNELKSIGKKLDTNFLENINDIQILSTNEFLGRLICEVGYKSGDVVLFYKSQSGTSGKEKGAWFPIPGFTKNSFRMLNKNFPENWFIKGSLNDISNRYGSKVFNYTADFIKAQENDIF